MALNIERSDHGLTVTLDGRGSLSFFLQTLVRAKFYGDDSVDGLLSPLLNNAIETTIESLGPHQSEAATYYSDWVARWHLDRVRKVISESSDYLTASPPEQMQMMRTALYPHQPTDVR